MKPALTLFLLFLFAFDLSAQKLKKRPKPEADLTKLKGWYLTANAFSLFDPVTPTFQFGTERRINKRLGVQATIGIPVRVDKDSRNTDSTFNNFYKLKGEIKFYRSKDPLKYFSIEAFYVHSNRSSFHQNFIRDHKEYLAEYAVFNKSIPGITAKLGALQVSRRTKKINGDVYVGAGIRFRTTKINDLNSIDDSGHKHYLPAWHEKEGFKITPHFVLAMNFQFRL